MHTVERSHKNIIRVIIALVVILSVAIGLYAYSRTSHTTTRSTQVPDRVLTIEQLKAFDGTDPSLPIYVGLDGLVFDVTAGKEFYVPGGSYHFIAGRNATQALHTYGADLIRKKYPVVARYTE